MLVPQPEVPALFEHTVKELDGVTLTPNEVVWLYELSKRACVEDRAVDAVLSPVIVCGKLKLHRHTIQSLLWLEEYSFRWWPDGLWRILAEGYALANAPVEGAFAELTEEPVARRRVFAWAIGIPATTEQLQSAIDVLNGNTPAVNIRWATYIEPKPKSTDWGAIVARACKELPSLSPVEIAHRVPLTTLARLLRENEKSVEPYEHLRAAVRTIKERHGSGS